MRWRDSRGQSAVIVALFLALAGAVMMLGAAGVGLAMADKAKLQSAADAAALAGAKQAVPYVELAVRKYARSCSGGGRCQDAPPVTVFLHGWAPDLLPDRWLQMAGCDARREDPATKRPGSRTVCEYGVRPAMEWRVNPDAARQAAEWYLAQNLGQRFKSWRVTAFRVVNPGAGSMPHVELTVQAEPRWNPLAAVVRKPLRYEVAAWAEPRDGWVPD